MPDLEEAKSEEDETAAVRGRGGVFLTELVVQEDSAAADEKILVGKVIIAPGEDLVDVKEELLTEKSNDDDAQEKESRVNELEPTGRRCDAKSKDGGNNVISVQNMGEKEEQEEASVAKIPEPAAKDRDSRPKTQTDEHVEKHQEEEVVLTEFVEERRAMERESECLEESNAGTNERMDGIPAIVVKPCSPPRVNNDEDVEDFARQIVSEAIEETLEKVQDGEATIDGKDDADGQKTSEDKEEKAEELEMEGKSEATEATPIPKAQNQDHEASTGQESCGEEGADPDRIQEYPSEPLQDIALPADNDNLIEKEVEVVCINNDAESVREMTDEYVPSNGQVLNDQQDPDLIDEAKANSDEAIDVQDNVNHDKPDDYFEDAETDGGELIDKAPPPDIQRSPSLKRASTDSQEGPQNQPDYNIPLAANIESKSRSKSVGESSPVTEEGYFGTISSASLSSSSSWDSKVHKPHKTPAYGFLMLLLERGANV